MGKSRLRFSEDEMNRVVEYVDKNRPFDLTRAEIDHKINEAIQVELDHNGNTDIRASKTQKKLYQRVTDKLGIIPKSRLKWSKDEINKIVEGTATFARGRWPALSKLSRDGISEAVSSSIQNVLPADRRRAINLYDSQYEKLRGLIYNRLGIDLPPKRIYTKRAKAANPVNVVKPVSNYTNEIVKYDPITSIEKALKHINDDDLYRLVSDRVLRMPQAAEDIAVYHDISATNELNRDGFIKYGSELLGRLFDVASPPKTPTSTASEPKDPCAPIVVHYQPRMMPMPRLVATPRIKVPHIVIVGFLSQSAHVIRDKIGERAKLTFIERDGVVMPQGAYRVILVVNQANHKMRDRVKKAYNNNIIIAVSAGFTNIASCIERAIESFSIEQGK